jgi:hypothetical protein
MVITGQQAVTGIISQLNNGVVATLNHGSGAGVPSLYLITTTRIIRVSLANITTGNTTFVGDQMTEVTPGGVNTNAVVGTFHYLDCATSIDKLVVVSASATTTSALYITDYYTGGTQIDRRSGCSTLQVPSSLRDMNSPQYVRFLGVSTPLAYVEDGWLFWVYNIASTSNLSSLATYPLAADLEYQTDVNNRIICPKINLGNTPMRFYRVLVNNVKNIGDNTFGIAPDMYLVQYRTTGIDDNSGSWTDVPQNGDISNVTPTTNIQFGFLFRTAGTMMLPARVLSLSFIYENIDGLPSQYRWNQSDFNLTNNTFAWRQVEIFGTYTISGIKIDIYRADTNVLVLTQDSNSTTNGNFQYWNGTTWVNGLDGDIIGLRRRFVPTASLPSTDLYAKISYI